MAVPRTDLAVETALELTAGGKIFTRECGVTRQELLLRGCPVTRFHVHSREGARLLGKPPGRYVTIDLSPALARGEVLTRRAAACTAEELRRLLPPLSPEDTVLVAGLGNPAMTPDSIGPRAVAHLLVTRHMVRRQPDTFAGLRPVAALCTDVLARTGLETLELLRGAAERIRPAAVIAIDALAARSRHRLCATVQMGDTGLIPGSGVGNHRKAVDRGSLGVPVIAVGIPTVIDGAALCGDTEETAPEGLFVTPQDIDHQAASLGRLVGYAVTMALQPGLTAGDIAALLG